MITGPQGTFYIDPQGNEQYRVYDRRQQKAASSFQCGTQGHSLASPVSTLARRAALRTPGSLRVYRLAVAATAEYTDAVKGRGSVTDAEKKADAMAEIGIAINRVNQIYQRDLGIKLELVGSNDKIIYTDASSDPYTNNDGNTMLGENQLNLDQVIGKANYDIGHVFSTGGGGIAEVGSVCDSDSYVDSSTNTSYEGRKAGGVTGLSNPVGENFYIDYVAHEIGHQFSGEHTFNGTEGSCNGNRWQATAFEPGSGSTIMSYGGICGSENITRNAIATFHAGTIDLVDDFTAAGNFGASCGRTVAIGNRFEPTVNAGADYTIPAQTPFVLTASAVDNDGDPITYSWDQMDAGTATTSISFGKDLGNNSLFRSYLPRTENQRHFPALGTTLQNLYDDSEVMACSSRALNFRVTVLDGNSGIGRDDVRISVTDEAGPFVITSHASAQSLSPGFTTLSWNVANTDTAPVNCQLVDISLLAFNAARTTYTEMPLLTASANDGSEQITIPNVSSSFSRLKIQCSENIFYDISDADLIITGSQSIDTSDKPVNYDTDGDLVHNLSSTPAAVCELTTGTSGGGNSSGGGTTTGGTTTKNSGSSGSPSSFDLGWLFLLLAGSVFQRKAMRVRAGTARR
jgi:hypothetical protein